MLNVTIDGKSLQVPKNSSLLQAALDNGFEIPRLCHHPDLVPSGGCRLCLVEVDGYKDPVPSCTMAAADGMVIRTTGEELYRQRRAAVDLLISDHPMDCATCEKAGDCGLQRYAYEYQLTETTLEKEIHRELIQDDNPFFLRDHKYCILCGRCTRVCEEVVGADAISFGQRGIHTYIATPFDAEMRESSCVFCGSCVQVCPTAALLPKQRMGQGREWDLDRVHSVCGYCGVGCQIEYMLKRNGDGSATIAYARGFEGGAANGEFLCTKGRYGWDFAQNKERLSEPLVRKDLARELGLTSEEWQMPDTSPLTARNANAMDYFVPVSWDQALDIVADRVADTVKKNGPDSVFGLSSARCTNEDNYVFQKMMRATIGTNNVDHCARLCHSSTVAGLAKAFGSGAMTNSQREVRDCDCVFITGSNTAEAHPVLSYEVVRAVKKGANLIIVDPRKIPLTRHATLHLQARSGTDIFIFLAMMNVILREGWADTDFIKARTENFDEFAKSVADITPEVASEQSGVPVADIEKAARIYALGERAFGVSRYGEERGRSSILYSMGITQRSNGTNLVLTLANLALLTGNLGKPSSGVNPLRGQANVQGACDLGALPNVLPGYQPVTDESLRQKVAGIWGLNELPDKVGLTVVEMIAAAENGSVQAGVIMGENPMLSDPDLGHVEKSLRVLPFLAVAEIFLSETAQLAHVVFPARSSLEKDGTFTNTERRVQKLTPVLAEPGSARDDWRIFAELSKRIMQRLGKQDASYDFADTAAVAEEIAEVSPIYGGITHDRLGTQGLAWPCPDKDHPGTPILHTKEFKRGKGKFHAVPPELPHERPDEEYPYVLSTGRALYHFHTGTMTRRSGPLHWKEPKGYVEINPVDAEKLEVLDGRPIYVESRRGRIRALARVTDAVPSGLVFVPFHFREAAANLLTHHDKLDPSSKIPELKMCAVRLENPAARKRAAEAAS